MPRTGNSIFSMVTLAVLGGAAPARAVAAERITTVAAGASRLYALRANRVVWFDAAGRETGHCARFADPRLERITPARSGAVDVEEALRLAGLPDDDPDSAEAETVLDDEGLATRRRAQPVAQPGIVA